MKHRRQLRGWLLAALIAIAIAVLSLLILHVQHADHGVFAAILPLLFVGIVSPLSLLSPLACFYLGRTPDAPHLPASFQRPPPLQLA
ncbi:MAG TPA: hypothetical protein VK716_11730 [Terracidiphilus sp.]|jgi:hypothetical protein|nr:hypothetical protein [Terracidiphilus sp.]